MTERPALSLRVRIAPTPQDRDDHWSFHNHAYARGDFFCLSFFKGMETVGWLRKREVERWEIVGWFKTRTAALDAALRYAREEATRRRVKEEAEADSHTDTHELVCAFAEQAEPYVAATETTPKP